MAWADILNKESKNSSGGEGVKYVNLKVGTTQMRILDSEPKSRWVHWIPQANGGKGMSVACIGKGCPICKAISEDKKAKRKTKYGVTKSHAINVFTRTFQATPASPIETINELQILDKGNKIFEQLAIYVQQMGDITGYDVKIIRVGEEFGTINYTVMPVYPPTPLDESVKALKKYDLDDITKPFTAEEIMMFMSGATFEDVINARQPQETPNPAAGATDAAIGETTAPFAVDYTQQV
jgi:hypothetical protein